MIHTNSQSAGFSIRVSVSTVALPPPSRPRPPPPSTAERPGDGSLRNHPQRTAAGAVDEALACKQPACSLSLADQRHLGRRSQDHEHHLHHHHQPQTPPHPHAEFECCKDTTSLPRRGGRTCDGPIGWQRIAGAYGRCSASTLYPWEGAGAAAIDRLMEVGEKIEGMSFWGGAERASRASVVLFKSSKSSSFCFSHLCWFSLPC